jgi:phosphate uptake regulator
MDYRKIIKFGNNSHVVSIPQAWIKQFNLKKGDILHLETIGDSLIYSPKKEILEEKKVISIPIKKDTQRRDLKRALISAYENNYDTIIFSGNEINKFTKTITKLTEEYIALEIVEITDQKLICKTYIKTNEVKIDRFVKRLDSSVKTIIQELTKEVDPNDEKTYEELVEDITHREKNIDKIVRLLKRVIRERFYKQKLDSNETPLDLLRYWQFILFIELVSDNLTAISKEAMNCKNMDRKKQINTLLSHSSVCFTQLMKAFHKKDSDMAHRVSPIIKALGMEIEKEQTNKEHNKMLEMISEIQKIFRLINRLNY